MKAIVSIHAPVKGRLALLPQGVAWSRVSIHAPVKGRRKTAGFSHFPAGFQSTPP